MIAAPYNDRECLAAITEIVTAMVRDHDPALVALADEHGSTKALAGWIRSLPQRDDDGVPGDGPRVDACRPAQRLRLPAEDPNCVERSALYIGTAELLDPGAVRRLATIETTAGLHTFPLEDGEPVVLDPQQTRNRLAAALSKKRRVRNQGPSDAVTAIQVVDWIAKVAAARASWFEDGEQRVENGHTALRALLAGQPLRIGDLRDVAFVLALAARGAREYGPVGARVVQLAVQAIAGLDRIAVEPARNALELRVGRHRLRPNTPLLGALGRVGSRIGTQIGAGALRAKLAALGVSSPVLHALERELNREGLSLGPLATQAMPGTFGALTPHALAGGWLGRRL